MIRAGTLADGAGVEPRGTMALERGESFRRGATAPAHGEDDMPIIDHSHAPEVPWRPGYRRWDVAGHEQGVSSTLSINRAEPGTGAPLHTHTMDELIVVLEGTLEVRLNGETHTVGPDHTVAVPPGAEHAFTVTGEGEAHLLVFFPGLDPYSAEHTRYVEGGRAEG